jgi:glycosyltransferase involved in cell wall biosynthesis
MRIVHFIEFFQPKLGYQETFLAREQKRAGHDVVVVTSDRYFPFPSYRSTVEPILGPRKVSPGSGPEEGVFTIRLATTPLFSRFVWLHDLASTILGLRPDIVHIHTLSNLSTFRLVMSLWQERVPLIIDDHMLFSVHRLDWIHALYYRLIRLAVRGVLVPRCAHFIGVADECSRYMREVYGIPAELIRTIPLGTDTESFYFDSAGRNSLRNEWGIAADDVAIGYVGKVVRKKGVHELVEAISPLLAANSQLRCVIVGNGEPAYMSDLLTILPKSDAGRLMFHGPVPNTRLRAVFSALDVCVWPREASMSLLDAAACERAVVCTNDQVSLERIAGGNGLAVKPGDVLGLREILSRLVSNQSLRHQLGVTGRRQAIDRHSWSSVSDAFVSVYKQAAREAPSGA